MHSWVLAFIVFASAAWHSRAWAGDATDEVRIGPDFAVPGSTGSPYPLIRAIQQRADVYSTDLGLVGCLSGKTEERPAFEWDLTDEIASLAVRVEDRKEDVSERFVVVLPSGKTKCSDNDGTVRGTKWPQGHYRLFMVGDRFMRANVRLEVPARTEAETKAALEALPRLTIPMPTNPSLVSLPVPTLGTRWDTCRLRNEPRKPRLPVARVTVSSFVDGNRFEFPRSARLVDGNQCVQSHEDLAPGEYVLWVDADAREGHGVNLLFRDSVRDPSPPAGKRRITIGTLAEPVFVEGTASLTPKGRLALACTLDGRPPDLDLIVEDLHQQFRLRSIGADRREQRVIFLGPLDGPEQFRNQMQCGESAEFPIAKGHYAVWVEGPTEAPYRLFVADGNTHVDPYMVSVLPDASSPIPRRALDDVYLMLGPFGGAEARDLERLTTLVTQGVDALFAFAATDVKGEGHLPLLKGEPLLILSANTDSVQVARMNGQIGGVDIRFVDVTRAAQGFPSFLVPEAEKRVSSNSRQWPETDKALGAYSDAEQEFNGCVVEYVAAHNPTSNGDRVYVYRGGQVHNIGVEVQDRAEAKCGRRRLEQQEQALLKQLDAVRKAHWKALYDAAVRRFGK